MALLPGSKRAKLLVGVPFLLETADRLAALRPGCRFLLPVAPTTSVRELLAYGGPSNPLNRRQGSASPIARGMSWSRRPAPASCCWSSIPPMPP